MGSESPTVRKLPRNLHSVVRDENAATAARARAIPSSIGGQETGTETSLEARLAKINRGCFGMFTGYEGCFHSRSSIPLVFQPQRPVSPPATRRVTRASMLQLKKIEVPPNYFLDRVQRNFISGRIVLEAIDPFYDYDFIDLQGREKVDDTPEALSADPCLFKVYPLALRSWHFQSQFEVENSVDSLVQLWHDGQKSIKSLDEIRADALEKKLSDDWIWLTYSSALPCFCSSIIACFTVHSFCLVVLCALLVFSVQVAKRCNTACTVQRERWITLLPRLGAIAWIFSLGMSPPYIRGKVSTTSSIPPIIRTLAGVVLLLDVIVGDVFARARAYLRGTRFVFRSSLHKKVLICERISNKPGIALSEAILGRELFEDQAAGKQFALIADLDGILCELHPLTVKDLPLPAATTGALKMYSLSVLFRHCLRLYFIQYSQKRLTMHNSVYDE